jgi:hypothetical protein
MAPIIHQGNKIDPEFNFGEKSVILTSNEEKKEGREGYILVIITKEYLPIKASLAEAPQIIYANRQLVQDYSNGHKENVKLWRGRGVPSILINMLGISASRNEREVFDEAVEKLLRKVEGDN